MNSASKHAVTALFVFSLAGCTPKNANTTPPPQAQAPTTPTPAPSAGKAGAMYPPPLTESQTQSQPTTPAPEPEVATTQPEPTPPPDPPPATKKTSSHKAKPSAAKPTGSDATTTPASGTDAGAASTGTGTPTGETAEVATTGQPAAASPIGELTPADTPEQAQKEKDTNDLISKTQDGLTNIKRRLSPQEQETVDQIRAFLDKAKKALGIEGLRGGLRARDESQSPARRVE